MRDFVFKISFLLLAPLALTVVSCEQADPLPEAPTITIAIAGVKTISLTWADVAGETEYKVLKDANGSGDFKEIATLAADSTSQKLSIFTPLDVGAKFKLQACNEGGCTDSEPKQIADILEAIGHIENPNPDYPDAFGGSIALSGDGKTLAIGAPEEDSDALGNRESLVTDSGAVYIFTLSDGKWSDPVFLKASNAGVYYRFGSSVSLSADGNTLAVGSPGEASWSGAVYVFTRSAGAWSQKAYIKASNTDSNDEFGGTVSLSADGNTLAVGAEGEDSAATGINDEENQGNNDYDEAGAVYVFTRSEDTWDQKAYVKASNTRQDNRFGTSLSLSADGNTLAVGSDREPSSATGINGDQDNTDARRSGAVYVFIRNASTWSQQAYIKSSVNLDESYNFGTSVSLSENGDTLAVGARYEGSNATGINGDQNNYNAPSSGAVYVFARNAETWSQQAYVKASNTEEDDNFGISVALSADGNTLAVGAPNEGSNATGINGDQANNGAQQSGAVYVFTRNNVAWNQQAYVKAKSELSDNKFGNSIALSADGQSLAVGEVGPDEDENNMTRAVYTY